MANTLKNTKMYLTTKTKRLAAAERAYDRSASKNFPRNPAPRTYDELLRAQSEDYEDRARTRKGR